MRKCILVFGIFICFLVCISNASAYDGVDNTTSLNGGVDKSYFCDYNSHCDDVLGESNSDVSKISHDVWDNSSLHDKLEKKEKSNYKNITVGNFSLLNKELSDFNDNKYYKIIDNGRQIRKMVDFTQIGKIHTFYLTKDYVYNNATDKDFINGINLIFSEKHLYNDIIINGNGHFIDGNGQACIFNVFGSNVEICNVIFKNLNTIPNYYHEELFGFKYPKLQFCSVITPSYNSPNAPIVWNGKNGKLVNCTFINNIGSFGGSLYWHGNNGIIEHNKFINNSAAFLGGYAYVDGKSNFINDNFVVNCTARLDGDALYVKNLTENNVDKMKLNYTNKTFIRPDVVDGSLINLKSHALKTAYIDLDNTLVDITPCVYGFLVYGCNYFTLDNGINAFATYDNIEHILSLTVNKFLSPTIEIRKSLNFYIYDDMSDVFYELFPHAVLQIIKHYTVNNVDDYKKANAFQASSLKAEYDEIKKVELVDSDIKFGSNECLMIFDVMFNKTLSIDCSLTWTPKGFDVICINGANSHIFTSNDECAEKKFVDWNGNSVFTVSNLKVSGFNNAFRNNGGQGLLMNVELFGNKMDYSTDRDYGAGILNTGTVSCFNCTFHDNKAKYGGAIFNQGLLTVNNCTFYSNKGYGEGNDIVNVDKGIVTIDCKEYKSCNGDYLVYKKSMSSGLQTVIKVCCYGGSFIIGAVAGFITANPLIGCAVGAAIGAAVGSIGSSIICSNVYDVNFNRWFCALSLIFGSAGAGASGGAIGGAIGAHFSAAPVAAQVEGASSYEVIELPSQVTSTAQSSFMFGGDVTKVYMVAQQAINNAAANGIHYSFTASELTQAILNSPPLILFNGETIPFIYTLPLTI